MDKKIILAIDFNNVVFASYYGQELINSKGNNVNAVKGFFFKLKMLKEMFDPDFIVFASDISRSKTFRRQIYPEYKAQRKPADPDIIFQMKYVSSLISMLGFQIINNELYEADDILGMISRLGEDNNMETIIISSDRDMYQLITESTYIMSPRNSDIIDLDYMMQNYNLTPQQWIELKTLQGDRGDNVPGINGVGSKTALSLMNEYGSIENIYSNLDNIKPGLRDRLITGKEVLPLTKELVTIITDYSRINLTLDSLYRSTPLQGEVFGMLQELELLSLFDVMKFSLLPQYNDKMEVR